MTDARPLARAVFADGLAGWRALSLAELGVPHLFTSRRGPGGSELCARAPGAEVERALARAAGAPAALLARARQVHGARVRRVAEADEPASPPEADALVTDRPDRLLCVTTADCVPLLVAARGGARVAAIHAGWRGLVAGVVERALAELAGGEPLDDAVAAVGPCLSLARFEVGPEVARAFERAGFAGTVRPAAPGGRPHVDLRAAALLALARGGVERADVSPLCTWDEEPLLHSYRRDVTHGERERTGLQAALVAPRR